MRKTFVHGAGGVVSADIAVPEHEREVEFYSKVLTTGDSPLWREDLMNNLGTPVIGLGVRTPEYESLPLQWMPHFQVADVAASVAKTLELGGKELMHSQTEDGESQWAAMFDLDGIAFGIIPAEPGESAATESVENFGCISWLSLTVPDVESSQDFYRQVIGWQAKAVQMTDDEGAFASFEMKIDEETAAAEICENRGERSAIPPVWLIHLPVDDLAESLRRVRENGGEVIKEFTESNCAVVRDPIGVCFALQDAKPQ